jgi:hypothetical protein
MSALENLDKIQHSELKALRAKNIDFLNSIGKNNIIESELLSHIYFDDGKKVCVTKHFEREFSKTL